MTRTISRYCTLILTGAVMMLFASCRSHKSIHSTPGHPEVGAIHVGKADKTQHKIVEEAMTWVGTPYKYAAQEKQNGTDCSGMVMCVYETVTGEKLPRNSAKQAEYCTPLDADQVETGDLVFFATGKDPDRVSHVGIIIDDVRFIHASSSKGVVVSDFTTPYYQRTFRMFGRVPMH